MKLRKEVLISISADFMEDADEIVQKDVLTGGQALNKTFLYWSNG